MKTQLTPVMQEAVYKLTKTRQCKFCGTFPSKMEVHGKLIVYCQPCYQHLKESHHHTEVKFYNDGRLYCIVDDKCYEAFSARHEAVEGVLDNYSETLIKWNYMNQPCNDNDEDDDDE